MRILFLFILEASAVSKLVQNVQPLQYDISHIENQHKAVRDEFSRRRRRRSLENGPNVELKFSVLKRDIHLILHGDSSAFVDDYEVEDSNGHSLSHRLDHLVTGKIKDQPGSIVNGQIRSGVFSGNIYSPLWGTYYVENQRQRNGVTHSVIYHEQDIKMPDVQCKNMYHQPVNESDGSFEATTADPGLFDLPMSHYYADSRMRRETDDDIEEESKNTCNLLIHVDHMFSNHQTFQRCTGATGGKCTVDREEILSFISSHVKAINGIYIRSPFIVKQGGQSLKIRPRFQVKRIIIDEGTNEADRFRSKNIGVEKFLEKASLANFDDYCLAYVFTKRDFQNGVLGLAWVAQPEGNSGGICEKNKKYTDGISKSLNTGIITIENYNSIVPEKVSHITFAHEIGHNFGSPHDDPVCSPGESRDANKKSQGNYIMYSRATAGDRPNNDKFSPCSYGNITAVLQRKRKCFVSSDAPICGNQIVDKGEECDCGFEEECRKFSDKCCYPADYHEKNLRCKRKRSPQTGKKYQCSPSEGQCCQSSTCSFKGPEFECSKDLDCTFRQTCDGTQSRCPVPRPKNNHSLCHKDTMVCTNGQCSGSVCLNHTRLEPCECVVDEDAVSEEERKITCHVCCQSKGEPETCKSTGELGSYFRNRTIFRQPGSPCNNYEGYCDVFSKCRSVDADGPLARLKKALFNPVLYSSIREWIVEYWWAVLLMALALVMLMGAFIKICSLHTTSDNPNLERDYPARDFPGAETLRRLQSGRRQHSRNPNLVQLNRYQGGRHR